MGEQLATTCQVIEKTLGEKRVRTDDFNPSQASKIDQIKQKSAELINFVQGLRDEHNGEQARLVSLAQTSYEEAAMWAIKAATA